MGLIQERVVGAFGGGGEVGSGDRVDDTGALDEFANGEGELVPTDTAFVAVVIDTGDETGAGQDMEDSGGQVGGVGGRADLVLDYIERRFFFHQAHHCFDE